VTEHIAVHDVAGLAMLAPGDPDRVRADAHAARCPKCAAALRDAGDSLGALDVLAGDPLEGDPASDPDAAAARLATVKQGVFAVLRADAKRIVQEGWVVLAGAIVAIALSFVIFPIRNHDALDHVEGLVAVAVALFAIFFASSAARAKIAVGLVLACSLSMIALEMDGDPDPAAYHGAFCSTVLGASAVLPACVAGWLAVRILEPGAGWRIAARAGAAGLAGQGALAVLCTNHGALHLLPFHFVGLIAAMLISAAIPAVAQRLRAPAET
jgi:hypothetical protein